MSSFGAVQLYKVAELTKLGVTREGFMVPVLGTGIFVWLLWKQKRKKPPDGVATKGYTM